MDGRRIEESKVSFYQLWLLKYPKKGGPAFTADANMSGYSNTFKGQLLKINCSASL